MNSANLTFENIQLLRNFQFLSASGGSPHLPVSGTRNVDPAGGGMERQDLRQRRQRRASLENRSIWFQDETEYLVAAG